MHELKQLTPRVWYFTPCQQGDRPALGYIRGDNFSVAVDAGNSAAHTGEFLQALAARGLPAPSFVVLTHWHWDHTFGLHALPCPVIAGEATQAKLREVARWKWDDASMLARLRSGQEIEMCHQDIPVEYPDRSAICVRTATLTFSRQMTLEAGGVSCVLTCVDSPHSRDAVLVRVPEEEVLFIGDADCGDHYENGGNFDPDRLRAFSSLLEATPFQWCVLGHDEPGTREQELAYLREEQEKL
ncbi:MAG: MBL fold metallo-hydrolase [Eubacteriales bacterium]|nr:MBL fold metallo-hydrolase [Eubacteriales bacterium]